MSRLRLIAGPNGSGKSTIFKLIKEFKGENHKFIRTGPFVNSDEIEKAIQENGVLDLTQFEIENPPVTLIDDYLKISTFSGKYDPSILKEVLTLDGNLLKVRSGKSFSQVGMFVSDLIRQFLLANKKPFTMETVFSDLDKIRFMKKAIAANYKIYFYFVSTEDPKINVRRVEGRVAEGGHPVPEGKIISRYDRTMSNLYEAVKLSYRAYIFDNSGEGEESTKKIAEKDKDGTLYLADSVPDWLIKCLRLGDIESVDEHG
jgi:predicted ABC-type ATPase